MATLILTAVGTAIGGPVGGAIGALLGQAADRQLLGGGKRREGPRLTELAVQTSSYGAPIPAVFGTMRVAGTVIWATDLIETRATSRAGKGQPGVTQYSYAASFAVALSSRPIRRIGRIWADGKLLRGAAGDFKVRTGFRLHAGGEDQPVDPLIASAVGIEQTSAHRGIAYAVFEQLQLADFGNRIPSLSFEVVADEGSVPIGAIAEAIAPEVKSEVALPLDGFAAGEGSVAATLALLGEAAGARIAETDGRVLLRADGATSAIVRDDGMRAGGGAAARRRSVAAIDGVPREIVLRHYDAARDYQPGVQRARRPGSGVRSATLDMPAVLAPAAARGMVQAMLARAEADRTRRRVCTDLSALPIPPGALVLVAGEPGRWRVVEARCEAMVPTLTLAPFAEAAAPVPTASGGTGLVAPDRVAGTTILHAFEIPALGEVPLAAPTLTIAAAGTGADWRQAALLYSLDAGASWQAAGGTAAPATLGVTASALNAGPTTLIDMVASVEVMLARGDMLLEDADDARLDQGANLALLGDELIQFGRAEPLGGARWRLRHLLRGRRGTEAAGAAAGARFVRIEADAAMLLTLPVAAIGARVLLMASGVGDDEPVVAEVTMRGASVRPPSPVGGTIVRQAEVATLGWTRRSRAGWRWIDGSDAPLGEESEAYRVTLTGPAGSRVVDTAIPYLPLTAAEQAGGVSALVRQRGGFGESDALAIEVPAA